MLETSATYLKLEFYEVKGLNFENNMSFEEYQFATPSYALSVALRYKILCAPLEMEFSEEDLSREWKDIHLGAFNKEGLLCACLVMTPIDQVSIKMRQVAVDDGIQGQGIGSKLVHFAEKVVRKRGFQKIVLNARNLAIIFYERMNYEKVGKEFIEVGIPHYKMVKKLHQQ